MFLVLVFLMSCETCDTSCDCVDATEIDVLQINESALDSILVINKWKDVDSLTLLSTDTLLQSEIGTSYAINLDELNDEITEDTIFLSYLTKDSLELIRIDEVYVSSEQVNESCCSCVTFEVDSVLAGTQIEIANPIVLD